MANNGNNIENPKVIDRIIADIDSLNVYESINTEKAFRRIKSKLGWGKSHFFNIIRNAAAIISIPLMIGVFALLVRHQSGLSTPEQMVELSTSPGMTARLTLPDSSTVILDACSSIRYPYSYASGRYVELKGEAYFEVKKNKKQKFVVSLANGNEINVYGTKFNVDAYDSEPGVSLVEGKIGYNYRDKTGVMHEQILMPGQKLTHRDDGSISVQPTDNETETAWIQHKIILNSTSLTDILKKLERKYNVTFDIQLDNVDTHSFSGGAITVSSLESILNALCISSSLKWSYINDENTSDDKPVIVITDL